MKRGSIVIAAQRGDFTGKPRPYLVVQRESTLADSPTLTACPITSGVFGSGQARIPIGPGTPTGLIEASEVQVSRIQSSRKLGVRQEIGEAPQEILAAVDVALRRWLDL